MRNLVYLFCLLLVCSVSVQAGGYRVALQGQKAQGVAHAGVAAADNVETIFFNPAGLANLNGNSWSTAINVVNSEIKYTSASSGQTTTSDNPVSTPVNLYWGKKIGEKSAFGFGIYTPYGSKVEYPTDWEGSHLINNIELKTVFYQPTYSIKINEKSSFGVGAIIATGSINLNRNLVSPELVAATGGPASPVAPLLQDGAGNRTNVTLDDSGIIEYGLNFGGLFTLSDKLHLGVNYRTEIKMESEGDADFENVNAGLATLITDGGYKSELPLPAELSLGIKYKYNDRLTLLADYNYTFWDAYEALTIEFDSVNDTAAPQLASVQTSVNLRQYNNTNTIRFGAEYIKSESLTLRGGIYYDETPVQDGLFAPETPRPDQLGLTGGFSYQLKDNLEIDFSALYLYFGSEKNSFDTTTPVAQSFAGTYDNEVWILGVGASSKF